MSVNTRIRYSTSVKTTVSNDSESITLTSLTSVRTFTTSNNESVQVVIDILPRVVRIQEVGTGRVLASSMASTVPVLKKAAKQLLLSLGVEFNVETRVYTPSEASAQVG